MIHLSKTVFKSTSSLLEFWKKIEYMRVKYIFNTIILMI